MHKVSLRVIASPSHPTFTTRTYLPSTYSPACPTYKSPFFPFLILTIRETAINKAVLCYLNSVLHIAEVQVAKLSSDILLA